MLLGILPGLLRQVAIKFSAAASEALAVVLPLKGLDTVVRPVSFRGLRKCRSTSLPLEVWAPRPSVTGHWTGSLGANNLRSAAVCMPRASASRRH